MIQPRQALSFALSLLLSGLAGCQHDGLGQTEASLIASNKQTGHAFGPEISAEDFAAHIRVLASDEFGGRQPGTIGEQKTVDYLREQFTRLGLEPGNNGSYFQDVPMLETRADLEHSSIQVRTGGKRHDLNFGDQLIIGTRTGQSNVHVGDSPMVFVGYGVNAPGQSRQ